MRRIKTPESSNVREYGYHKARRIIEVQFADGAVYQYFNRAPWFWRQFRLASSKGEFVYRFLTPGGNYRKIKGQSY